MKNRCFQRKAKRLLTGLMALVMMVTAIPPMSAYAVAGTTKYSYDGYDVEYTITGEWSTGQNVEVEITNTGDKSILNWAFRYDAGSEIVNIWNATITENQGTEYVVKNNGWNYEILPQQSISFGYTLAEGDIPVSKEFELYSKRVEVTNGYEVKLNTINEWGTGAQAEIVISNTSDKELEAWEIAFDCNFTIDGFWGARKVDFEGKDYGFASEVWSNPIPAGGSVSIGFTASIDGEMKIDNFSMTEVEIEKLENDLEGDITIDDDLNDKLYVQLATSEVEFLADNTYRTICFYARTNSDVAVISLVDNETNTIVAELSDDGNYAVSGDDMMGDGIYSAKHTIFLDESKDTDFSYKVVVNEEITSNVVEINSYAPFVDGEISDMEYVLGQIEEVFQKTEFPEELLLVEWEEVKNDSEYASALEKRYFEMCDMLEALKKEGKLYSYSYDKEAQHFICQYPNGIMFIVKLSTNAKAKEGEIQYSKLTGDATGYSIAIFNSFENDTFRTPFYENLKSELVDRGANVSYDDNVTVYDLMNSLEGKDIICLSGHGCMAYGGKTAFCLMDDVVTSTSLNYYVSEIKSGRIIQLLTTEGMFYGVYSDFIDFYYGGSSLNGSFVFSEACEFMGNNAVGYNTVFADAFINSSSQAVVGFHNSVSAVYSRDFMVHYIDEMLGGRNASDAFTNACTKYGTDDSKYKKGTGYPIATPYLIGDESARLVRRLKNGNFEESSTDPFSKPYGWDCEGDVRVLKSLGEINAYGQGMAFISTGIGSSSQSDIEGMQGSMMKQKIKNINFTELSFYYNCISEEPMEYVGSSYDDRFTVRISDMNGNILYREDFESVNTSIWYPVNGINFDGGDSTVYQTNWKIGSVDISPFQGQEIEIEFIVCDMGDSAFDTAVVIDNVLLDK